MAKQLWMMTAKAQLQNWQKLQIMQKIKKKKNLQRAFSVKKKKNP